MVANVGAAIPPVMYGPYDPQLCTATSVGLHIPLFCTATNVGIKDSPFLYGGQCGGCNSPSHVWAVRPPVMYGSQCGATYPPVLYGYKCWDKRSPSFVWWPVWGLQFPQFVVHRFFVCGSSSRHRIRRTLMRNVVGPESDDVRRRYIAIQVLVDVLRVNFKVEVIPIDRDYWLQQ